MSDMRRLINIVSKNDSNRVLTENQNASKNTIDEIEYNNSIADSGRMIQSLIPKNSKKLGVVDHRTVYRLNANDCFVYYLYDDDKNTPLAYIITEKNSNSGYYPFRQAEKCVDTPGVAMALLQFLRHSGIKLMVRVNEPLTLKGITWLSKMIETPRGLKIHDGSGKKWQLQHHCKGPSKNQDKDVSLIFKTLDLKNSQIEEYTKKYFECYNIDQPHGKFISNIKRLSKINESTETTEIASFINMLHQIDSKKKIKIGDKFAVLEFEIIFAYKEINGRGFVTPKEVEEIKLHSDGKINYIKFTDGDRYPRLTPAHYEGKPVTYAAYFANKNYAQQALSAIILAVPDEWDLDISDINQESMTEEKLITQHKPGKCTQCGGPSYDDEQLAEEKDACYRKVKSRYKVWPSAYACVPEETSKALTKTGWKSVDDLVIGEEIMTFNMEKDLLEFKPILNLHRYTNAPTSVIKSGNTGFVFESTLNHKWVIKHPETKSDRVTKYEKINNMSLLTTSQLLESKTNKHLVVSAPFEEGQNIRKDKIFKYGDNWTKYILDISPEQRQTWLFSAIVYDGHQIRTSRLTNNDKNINDLDWIYSGNYGKQSFGFRQKDIEHRDAFLLAAFLNGGTVTWKPHNIQKDIYSCYYVSNKRYKNLSNIRQIDSKITNVWCPETENNTWVMMQETEGSGIITITGNSGALVKCRKVGAKNWGNKSKK